MVPKSFNLITQPWLKVIEKENYQTQLISLKTLFENTDQYLRLAGDLRSQDLCILRLLLAILQTVYSRVDAQNQPYSGVNVDPKTLRLTKSATATLPDTDDLLDTWQALYKQGHFTNAIDTYLTANQDCFDFFGDHPFYQVTKADYDRYVPAKKQINTGSGTVGIKQINRLVSESGNTTTILTSKAGIAKNKVTIPELVRWLIMYQNFTGVTDKTKVNVKVPNSAGWVYHLNPVFVQGDNLFETLILNLNLVSDQTLTAQKPVWEYQPISDYIDERAQPSTPTNLAALYTSWSRLLHIEWTADGQPTIFSAGLPKIENKNFFLEPMTVWNKDLKATKEKKIDVFKPAIKTTYSLGIAMWRNFGEYINLGKGTNNHQPGIVTWLQQLKTDALIDRQKQLHLASVALVSDGNMSSQSPIIEIHDDLSIKADVLFDSAETTFWPQLIADEITLTQAVAKDYWSFAINVGSIRFAASDSSNRNEQAKTYASNESAKFYDRLNAPFKQWLASLSSQDKPQVQIDNWHAILRQIVRDTVQHILAASSPRDITGIMVGGKNKTPKLLNIFIAKNYLMVNLNKRIPAQKG